MDPSSPSARLSRELAPDEQLLWSGRPRQGFRLQFGDLFLVPFSLFWCGFAVVWEVMVFRGNAPYFFRFFGIPFVLIGLYMVFGRFVVDSLQRRRTVYGVTTTRVIIISGVLRETVESHPLRSLASLSLTLRPDGSGDIAIGPRSPLGPFLIAGWPGTERFRTPAFEGIPGAREVHDLIARAQA